MRRAWAWLRNRDPGGFLLRRYRPRGRRRAGRVRDRFEGGRRCPGRDVRGIRLVRLAVVRRLSGRPSRASRCLCALAVVGVALISLGTVIASPDWLAVVAMAVVAFAVLFVGVVSSVINGAMQAALLAFILAVMLPASAAICRAARPAGPSRASSPSPWRCSSGRRTTRTVAPEGGRAVPGDWRRMLHLAQPPRPRVCRSTRRRCRRRSARRHESVPRASCGRLSGPRLPGRPRRAAVPRAVRAVGRASSSGSARRCRTRAPTRRDGWPEQGRRLRAAAARRAGHERGRASITAGAARLSRPALVCDHVRRGRSMPARTAGHHRGARGIAGEVAPASRRSDGDGRRVRRARSTRRMNSGYAVALVGPHGLGDRRRGFAVMGGAAARTPWAALNRVRPRPRPAARHGHLDRHSVWLQNSIRGARRAGVRRVALAGVSMLRTPSGSGSARCRYCGRMRRDRRDRRASVAGTVVGFAVGGVAGRGSSAPTRACSGRCCRS